MKTTLVIEIIIIAIAILVFFFLYDVIVKRQSAGKAIKTRISALFTNSIVYRILSISLTVLIVYLLYTLFFK